jgi:two-component sensor histidine kinase/putative methionine-R-sulfoxide reductase with GAF domain
MGTPAITTILAAHTDELRRQLAEYDAEGRAPEPGSDAAMFLDALCGLPPDVYTAYFAASGASLAEQGGHLERRLTSFLEWQAVLSRGLDAIFSADAEHRAEAQRFLGVLGCQIIATISLAFQQAQTKIVAHAKRQARRGRGRLKAMQRINAAANSTLDLDQTLAVAAQTVCDEMGADLCSIFLFDELTHELNLRATNGPLPRVGNHYTLTLREGYTGWVANNGRPLLLPDATQDDRFAVEATAYAEPYRGLLAVPIIFFNGVKLQGVIAVQSRRPRQFSVADRDFLEIVAGQLAMNIENAHLYEQTDEQMRRKIHELSTLHHVSSLITSTLVLDTVLRNIVAQAVLLSGGERSVLFELEPQSGSLRAVASHGFDTPEVERATVEVGRCCAGRVIKTGVPSAEVDCLHHDHGCFLHDLEAASDQHVVLCAPLSTGRGPIGALCIFSSQRHMPGQDQLQLVVTFANVAAIAMENARLFTETRQGLRTKENLLREMHHRVKNNLQQVASMLNLRAHRSDLPEVEQLRTEVVERIQGIAATHDLLSRDQLGMAPIEDIARKIVGIVRGNLVPPDLSLRFVIGPAPMRLQSEQATTFAIILNELIANAIEHGYPGRERGEIRINAAESDEWVTVRVSNNGEPLPEGFSISASANLGLRLVNNLAASDLRGSFTIFELTGTPDLAPQEAAVPPDAATLPTTRERDQPAEQRWIVAEVRFPLAAVEVAEPGGLRRETL